MRKITLQTFDFGTVANRSDWAPLVVGDTIKAVVEAKPNGMQIAEMRQCLRIHDIVDAAGASGSILLEDADYAYLKSRVDAHVWPVASKGIVQFVEAIEAAPTVDPNAPEPPV